MMDKILQSIMEAKQKSPLKLTLEFGGKKEEDVEKEEGLAPKAKEIDYEKEKEAKKLEVEAEMEAPPVADDDMDMANALLMSEKDKEDMAEMDEKPKSLAGKVKQKVAKGLAKAK